MTSASPNIKYAYLCAFRDIVGGGQAGMLLHFKYADRARFTPLLVCPGEGELSRRVVSLGVESVFFACPRMGLLSLPKVLGAALSLRRLLARQRAVLAHADTLELAALAGAAALFSPVKVVFHARVSDSGGLWDRLVPLLCDSIICVSNAAARRFPDSKKVRVVYNGVESVEAPSPEETARLRRALGLAPEHLVVGYCGQLVKEKGLPTLLRAFASLKNEFPHARLVLSGRGDEAGLKALAGEMGIADVTLFTGFREDNSPVRACIDIFVLPGIMAEGLPRSVLEAMALGRPVVLTPCGGSAETIVDGESGFFMPVGDAGTLAAKLRLLLSDPSLRARLGAAAKKRMLEHFEVAGATRAIEAVYLELLQ